jgi:hypothetical protein
LRDAKRSTLPVRARQAFIAMRIRVAEWLGKPLGYQAALGFEAA